MIIFVARPGGRGQGRGSRAKGSGGQSVTWESGVAHRAEEGALPSVGLRTAAAPVPYMGRHVASQAWGTARSSS